MNPDVIFGIAWIIILTSAGVVVYRKTPADSTVLGLSSIACTAIAVGTLYQSTDRIVIFITVALAIALAVTGALVKDKLTTNRDELLQVGAFVVGVFGPLVIQLVLMVNISAGWTFGIIMVVLFVGYVLYERRAKKRPVPMASS